MYTTPGAIFATLHILCNLKLAQEARVFVTGKLGVTIIRYDENKVCKYDSRLVHQSIYYNCKIFTELAPGERKLQNFHKTPVDLILYTFLHF